MGFAYNTAVTDDSDLFSYAFEQEIPALLREAGKADFSDVHKAAVNALIKDLKKAGYDPATITNTDDFKEELVYWVLMTIFRGEALTGNRGAVEKYKFYVVAWEKAKQERYIEDTSNLYESKLPQVANADQGPYYEGKNNRGRNFMRNEIDGYDDLVHNNTL